ncbi:MAG: hypothetical protein IJV24_05230 [Prevotella sp.]|nr:hypothetical protein [Prevotella sp.]
MKRAESPLQKKSEAYSGRIVKLYRYLLDVKKEKVMANQIYRSETEYWLGSIYGAGLIDQLGYDSMKNDNTEIIKMLTSSINTMKKKLGIPKQQV